MAHFQGGKCEIWSPTQVPQDVRDSAAQALGIDPDQVKVNVLLMGGGFGRRLEVDGIVVAARMAETRLPDWRFEPAADNGSAANRVEWSFKLNPYAGGEVRNFARTSGYEREFGFHRPITVEARLYLNGEYQTLVDPKKVR